MRTAQSARNIDAHGDGKTPGTGNHQEITIAASNYCSYNAIAQRLEARVCQSSETIPLFNDPLLIIGRHLKHKSFGVTRLRFRSLPLFFPPLRASTSLA